MKALRVLSLSSDPRKSASRSPIRNGDTENNKEMKNDCSFILINNQLDEVKQKYLEIRSKREVKSHISMETQEKQLDIEFEELIDEVNKLSTKRVKHDKIRISQWIQKFKETTSHSIWKQNRNQYARNLRNMLVTTDNLTEPFCKLPPESDLPNLSKMKSAYQLNSSHLNEPQIEKVQIKQNNNKKGIQNNNHKKVDQNKTNQNYDVEMQKFNYAGQESNYNNVQPVISNFSNKQAHLQIDTHKQVFYHLQHDGQVAKQIRQNNEQLIRQYYSLPHTPSRQNNEQLTKNNNNINNMILKQQSEAFSQQAQSNNSSLIFQPFTPTQTSQTLKYLSSNNTGTSSSQTKRNSSFHCQQTAATTNNSFSNNNNQNSGGGCHLSSKYQTPFSSQKNIKEEQNQLQNQKEFNCQSCGTIGQMHQHFQKQQVLNHNIHDYHCCCHCHCNINAYHAHRHHENRYQNPFGTPQSCQCSFKSPLKQNNQNPELKEDMEKQNSQNISEEQRKQERKNIQISQFITSNINNNHNSREISIEQKKNRENSPLDFHINPSQQYQNQNIHSRVSDNKTSCFAGRNSYDSSCNPQQYHNVRSSYQPISEIREGNPNEQIQSIPSQRNFQRSSNSFYSPYQHIQDQLIYENNNTEEEQQTNQLIAGGEISSITYSFDRSQQQNLLTQQSFSNYGSTQGSNSFNGNIQQKNMMKADNFIKCLLNTNEKTPQISKNQLVTFTSAASHSTNSNYNNISHQKNESVNIKDVSRQSQVIGRDHTQPSREIPEVKRDSHNDLQKKLLHLQTKTHSFHEKYSNYEQLLSEIQKELNTNQLNVKKENEPEKKQQVQIKQDQINLEYNDQQSQEQSEAKEQEDQVDDQNMNNNQYQTQFGQQDKQFKFQLLKQQQKSIKMKSQIVEDNPNEQTHNKFNSLISFQEIEKYHQEQEQEQQQEIKQNQFIINKEMIENLNANHIKFHKQISKINHFQQLDKDVDQEYKMQSDIIRQKLSKTKQQTTDFLSYLSTIQSHIS